jgi:glycosyltransferase involved in cell wall biosynthesis
MLAGLAKRATDVLLILFNDGELAAQARALGAEPVILPGENLKLFDTARRLAKVLEERTIRVVHLHGYKAAVLCALARRRYPFAIVKTEHGLPEPMAGNPTRAWRDRFYRALERFATKTGGMAVCYVTRDLKAYHERFHAGLHATVIPNGVESMDRARFPRPGELRADRFNALIVGRLDLVKGHHVAIAALQDGDLSCDMHLCIVGDGPRRDELQELAARRGVAERVHLLGFRRNVYDYIAHCDALLMPSIHEGLPYTLLEAMALGVPIIASRVGGLAEVLQEDGDAILVEPNRPAELAHALRRLKSDPSLAARLGARAQAVQRARYSLEAMTDRYLGVYREALG